MLGADTRNFWIIDSIMDMTLNLPDKIHNIFVADITHCYETIHVEGDDNLVHAISKLILNAFQQNRMEHPRSLHQLWVKFDEVKMTATTTKWASSPPSNGIWVELSAERLISLNKWLCCNCFITLGDRVWKQIMGIPMGFSCSPLWCNLYFLYYESTFIARLASLGRVDLMNRFKHSFRYIDDLCILNNGDTLQFLDPNSIRTPSNPFWIYPLNIVEIKMEVDKFSSMFPNIGIDAHFMNVQISVLNELVGSYRLRKFDKRRNLPFKYAQYLQFRSNRNVAQSYNIVQSQAFPILYLSNNSQDAILELELLVHTLCINGFRRQRLVNTLLKFLRNGSFPGTPCNLDDVINYFIR